MNFSTFTALSEVFVTSGVLYVVLTNLKGQSFKWKVALALVIFEFSVNMLYMIYRLKEHVPKANLSGPEILLAATHGTLSLIVFILFATYSCIAYAENLKNRFFFREHKIQTWVFLTLWMISVISGEILYFLTINRAPLTGS